MIVSIFMSITGRRRKGILEKKFVIPHTLSALELIVQTRNKAGDKKLLPNYNQLQLTIKVSKKKKKKEEKSQNK